MQYNTHAKRPKDMLAFHPYRKQIKRKGSMRGASLEEFKARLVKKGK
jgi:hypothetical protein